MPDNARVARELTQTFTLGDRRFIGIDTNTPPNMLDVGFLQDVNNLWVDGLALSPRPGWQAQLTSTLADPIYAITAYRTADGSSNRLFFVSGSSLYYHTVGGSTATAVTGTGTWTNASQVRLKQFGKYIYGVPGKDGTAIFRVDGNASVPVLETVPQTQPPTIDGTTYVKPVATSQSVNLRSIGAQQVSVSATVTLSTTSISGTNTFVAGDRIKFVTSTVSNITAGTTYYIISASLTTTTFRIATSAGGTAITPTGGTGGTFTVVLANDIDNYYLELAKNDFGKNTVTDYPTVWSKNLFKNGRANPSGTEITTDIPAGEFDSYPDDDDLPGDLTIQDDWTGTSAQTDEYVDNRSWKPDTQYKIQPPPNAPSYTYLGVSYTQKYMRIYNTGGYIQHIIKALPTEKWSPDTTSKNQGLYNLQFYSLANIIKSEAACKFIVTLWGQDSSNNDIPGCVFSKEYSQSFGNSSADWVFRDIIVDFREYVGTLNQIRIRIQNTSSTANQELLVDMMRFFACPCGLDAAGPYTGLLTDTSLAAVRFRQLNTNLSPGKASYVKNRRIRIIAQNDSQASLDLKSVTAISFKWQFNPSLIRANETYPNTRLGLQVGSTIQWSSIGVLDKTNGYMTYNLFGLSEAEKTNVTFMYIQFDDDVLTADGLPFSDNELAFGIGKMVSNLGLTDQSIYEYAITRWYPSDASGNAPYLQLPDGSFAKGFESDLSDISASITATSALASVSVSLNPNDSNGYGSNICIEKRPIVVATDSTDPDQWVVTEVPGTSQIRLVSTASSPSITYIGTDGSTQTVNAGSWSSIAAPDGTTYKVYAIPATAAGRIKYVTALGSGGTYWLEHYVSYGYSSTSKYTYALVYRRNNTLFPDGRFRLVAAIPIVDTGSQTYSGNGWTASYNNATSRVITFVDSVPDANLFYQTTPYTQGWLFEVGRNNMPLGTSTITAFQNRLWVSKANKIYASWAIDATDEYKLYTSEIPNLDDPAVVKKGASFTVGGSQEKEIIQNMIPLYSENIQQSNTTTSMMLVLKENSITTILGFDPTTFTVQLWVGSPGVGISAPLTANNADGTVTWLSVNGLVQWANGGVAMRSLELRKLISLDPTMSGPSNIDKDQYRKSICVSANKRIFLLTTSSGAGAANQTIYVFDYRTKGWVKWSTINSIEYTSLGVLSLGDDVQYLYAGSTTGQLYKLNGDGDKLTTATANTGIPWSLKTRQHAQTYSEGVSYYAYNRPFQLDLHIDNPSAVTTGNDMTVTWAVENQSGVYNVTTNPNGVSSSSTYTFPSKTNKTVAIRNIDRAVKGSAIQVRLSGTTTGNFYIRAIHVHVYDGGIPRS